VLRKRLRFRAFFGNPFEPDPDNTGVGNAVAALNIFDASNLIHHTAQQSPARI